jgi:tetratricopeptide (TPR) repeat protein
MCQVVIRPSHCCLYQWTSGETEKSVEVTVDLPDDVDVNSLSLEVPDVDDPYIEARFGEELPFLAGATYDQISQCDRTLKGRELVINFVKKIPGMWKRFITGPIPDSEFVIDPQSAFELGVIALGVAEVPDLEEDKAMNFSAEGLMFLQISLSANFPPALLFHATNLLQAGNENGVKQAKELLNVASAYGFPNADWLLGIIAVKEKDFEKARDYFHNGMEGGDLAAQNCLGELYSPVEGEHTGLENEQMAVEIFEDILQRKPDHSYALYNLAKLYFYGKGVKKSVATAKRLYYSAQKSNPQIPEFDFHDAGPDEEQKGGGVWVQAGIAVAAVGAAVFAWKVFGRRKR